MNWREKLADWISGGVVSALEKQRRALSEIIACETPTANATVRRMAAIAREAVK